MLLLQEDILMAKTYFSMVQLKLLKEKLLRVKTHMELVVPILQQ